MQIENKCNKIFIRWQKAFEEERIKKWTTKLKVSTNKVNDIKECIEKI